MVKQPGHLTSMKKERGEGTRVCRIAASKKRELDMGREVHRAIYTLSLCLRASAAGEGLRRSTAKT